jgi:hypothetical protein
MAMKMIDEAHLNSESVVARPLEDESDVKKGVCCIYRMRGWNVRVDRAVGQDRGDVLAGHGNKNRTATA